MTFRSGIVVSGEPAREAMLTITVPASVAEAVISSLVTVGNPGLQDFKAAVQGEIKRLENLRDRLIPC